MNADKLVTENRKLKKEVKRLKQELAEQKGAYEFLWKMRIQDEMERKAK